MMFALRAKMAAKKHWFHGKSPEAKKAYIAAHPNSIYAKQVKPVMSKRNPMRLTTEQRESLRTRRAEEERERARAFHEMQDRRQDPKAHAKRMKEHDKNIKLYSGKADGLAKKVDAAKAKVAKHTASGSHHLSSAKANLRAATLKHESMKQMVDGMKTRKDVAQKAHEKHHAKKAAKAPKAKA